MHSRHDDLTVEQLLAAADDLAAEPLATKLGAVRHTATDSGVTVTVDLHGKLVDLTIDHTAIRLSPTDLATKLQTLTDQAATAALTDGLAVLATTCDESLISDLTAHLRR